MAVTGFSEISGITGSSRSAYALLLKNKYGPLWDNWIHEDGSKLAKRIAKKRGDIGGSEMLFAVSTALPASSGISSWEGRPLPTPRPGAYLNPEAKARDLYARLRWTGQVERAARAGDTVAWAKPRQKDVEDARLRFDLNFERKLFLGPYDILSVVNAVTGSPQTFTMKQRNSRTSGVVTPRNWFNFGTFYMHQNQSIEVISVSATPVTGIAGAAAYVTNATANERFIQSLNDTDYTAPTITVDSAMPTITNPGSGSYAQNDLIVPFASRKDVGEMESTAVQRNLGSYFSINGLGNICTGTTKYAELYGLSKTSSSKLYGVEVHNNENQRAWGEMLLTITMHRIRNDGSGRAPDAIVLGESMIREVVKENRGDRRFEPVQGESGYGKMVFTAGDISIAYEENWQCPPGIVFPLFSSSWGWYEESPMGPIDDQLNRWVQDQDAHEIIWHKSGEIVCSYPHANGTVDDLIFDQYQLT